MTQCLKGTGRKELAYLTHAYMHVCMCVRTYVQHSHIHTLAHSHAHTEPYSTTTVCGHTLQRHAEMQDMLYHHKPMEHSITSLGGYQGQDENAIYSTWKWSTFPPPSPQTASPSQRVGHNRVGGTVHPHVCVNP